MKYITPIIVLFISIAGAGLAHAEYERSEVGSLRLNSVVNATASSTMNRESEQEDGDDNDGDVEAKFGEVMNQVSEDNEREVRDQMKEVEKNKEEKKDLRDDNDDDSDDELEDGDDDSATGTEMRFHSDDFKKMDTVARQDLVTKAAAITTVVTDADLKLVTQAALIKDPNIVKIGIADDHVTMDYRQPAKLFGFIPIKLLVSSSIDGNGKIIVQYPWLAKISKTNKNALDAAVLAQDSLAEAGATDQLNLQMMLDKKAKLEEMLSNLMKKVSETSDAITQNLK